MYIKTPEFFLEFGHSRRSDRKTADGGVRGSGRDGARSVAVEGVPAGAVGHGARHAAVGAGDMASISVLGLRASLLFADGGAEIIHVFDDALVDGVDGLDGRDGGEDQGQEQSEH